MSKWNKLREAAADIVTEIEAPDAEKPGASPRPGPESPLGQSGGQRPVGRTKSTQSGKSKSGTGGLTGLAANLVAAGKFIENISDEDWRDTRLNNANDIVLRAEDWGGLMTLAGLAKNGEKKPADSMLKLLSDRKVLPHVGKAYYTAIHDQREPQAASSALQGVIRAVCANTHCGQVLKTKFCEAIANDHWQVRWMIIHAGMDTLLQWSASGDEMATRAIRGTFGGHGPARAIAIEKALAPFVAMDDAEAMRALQGMLQDPVATISFANWFSTGDERAPRVVKKLFAHQNGHTRKFAVEAVQKSMDPVSELSGEDMDKSVFLEKLTGCLNSVCLALTLGGGEEVELKRKAASSSKDILEQIQAASKKTMADREGERELNEQKKKLLKNTFAILHDEEIELADWGPLAASDPDIKVLLNSADIARRGMQKGGCSCLRDFLSNDDPYFRSLQNVRDRLHLEEDFIVTELCKLGPERLHHVLQHWDRDQTLNIVQIAANNDPGMEEIRDRLEKTHSPDHKCKDAILDSVLPFVDYTADLVNVYTFFRDKQYHFLGLSVIGVMFCIFSSSYFILKEKNDQNSRFEAVIHLFTLGLYGLLKEAVICAMSGKKTALLIKFKLCESIESFVGLGVNAYSTLISGYLDGHPELTGSKLMLRWISILTSLVTLSWGLRKISTNTLAEKDACWLFPMKSLYLENATTALGKASLFGMHAGEISWTLTVLVFQLATRPFGIFIFGAVYYSVPMFLMVISYLAGARRRDNGSWAVYALGAVPVAMLVNPILKEKTQSLDAAICAYRCMAIVSAWGVLGYTLAMHSTQKLVDHLMKTHIMALMAIGGLGSILYLSCLWLQRILGRFNMDNPMENDGNTRTLPNGQTIRSGDGKVVPVGPGGMSPPSTRIAPDSYRTKSDFSNDFSFRSDGSPSRKKDLKVMTPKGVRKLGSMLEP